MERPPHRGADPAADSAIDPAIDPTINPTVDPTVDFETQTPRGEVPPEVRRQDHDTVTEVGDPPASVSQPSIVE